MHITGANEFANLQGVALESDSSSVPLYFCVNAHDKQLQFKLMTSLIVCVIENEASEFFVDKDIWLVDRACLKSRLKE